MRGALVSSVAGDHGQWLSPDQASDQHKRLSGALRLRTHRRGSAVELGLARPRSGVRAAKQIVIVPRGPLGARRMRQVREPFYLLDQSPAGLALMTPLIVEDFICPIVVLVENVREIHRRKPVSTGCTVKLADDARSGTSEGPDPVL